MGNLALVFLLALLVLTGCESKPRARNAAVVQSVARSVKLELDKTKSPQELVLVWRNQELATNEAIQTHLRAQLRAFFEEQTELFIDNEFGFVRTWGHLWDEVVDSDQENQEKFQRIYRSYFKTTALHQKLDSYLAEALEVRSRQRLDLLMILQGQLPKQMDRPELSFEQVKLTNDAAHQRISTEFWLELGDVATDLAGGVLTTATGGAGGVAWTAFEGLKFFGTVGVLMGADEELRQALTAEWSQYIDDMELEVQSKLNDDTQKLYETLQKTISL